MPRRYTKKKRTYKRRRTGYRRKRFTASMGAATIFPRSQVAKLRYTSSMQLTSVFGSLTSDTITLTSPYAPESSGGHQPLGFDQHTALYNHYVVLGAKVTFKVLDYTTGNGGASMVGSYISDDNGAPYSTYTSFIEGRRGPYRAITNMRNSVGWTSKFSTKKFFNVTDVKDNLDRLGSGVTTSPLENAYMHVWAQCLNATDASSQYTIQYTIDYIIAFSEPKDIIPS